MKNKVLRSFKGDSLRSQLMRGGVGSILVKILGVGLSLVISVLLARILGPKEYGIYALAFSIITIISVPTKLGLPQLVLRETAKAHVVKQWGLMRGIWRWSTIAVCVFSILAAIIVLTSILIASEEITNLQTTLVVGLILIPLISLANLRDGALKGLKHVVLGQLTESVIRPLFFVIILLISYYGLDFISPIYAMGAQALSAMLAFFFGVGLLFYVRPIQLKSKPICEYRTKEWMGAALPLAMISGMQIINSQTDIIMLGFFRSSEEVGIYKIVVTGSTLVAFGLQAIIMVVAPHFASLHASGEVEKLQKVVTQSARVTLAIALPIFIVLALFGDLLIKIVFGSAYIPGYLPLTILAFGQLINAIVGHVGLLLNMSGNEKETFRGVFIAVVSNITLNALLIPTYGIFGAATATAITFIVWNLILRRAVIEKLKIEPMAFKFG